MQFRNSGSDNRKSYPYPPARPKSSEKPPLQEDAWINDTKPMTQIGATVEGSQNRGITYTQLEPVSPLDYPRQYIEYGHPLWSPILRLSERICQEIRQKPDLASLPETILVDFIRKRAIELLRADTVLANQVRDVSEAGVLFQHVTDEVIGYGPLELLLGDEHISEIMVIGPRLTFVVRAGKLEEVPCAFEDEQHMQRIIDTMIRRSGRHMPPNWTIADIRLPEDALVNIVLPPSAFNGPAITIRKMLKEAPGLAQLVQREVMTDQIAELLRAAIEARLNIVICGGADADRNMLLQALAGCIPAEERIVTIEDVAELHLNQRHVVSLVSQLTSSGDNSKVTMQDLVINALRMSPERIIVSECRGAEVVELVQAMYMGWNGCLLTLFAHSIRDCLLRLETLSQLGGLNVPASLLRMQLAQSIDLVVCLARLSDGSCKVMNIGEPLYGDPVKIQSLFHFRQSGIDQESGKVMGSFEPSGFNPTFIEKLEAKDVHLPYEMFVPGFTQSQTEK